MNYTVESVKGLVREIENDARRRVAVALRPLVEALFSKVPSGTEVVAGAVVVPTDTYMEHTYPVGKATVVVEVDKDGDAYCLMSDGTVGDVLFAETNLRPATLDELVEFAVDLPLEVLVALTEGRYEDVVEGRASCSS